ncbi:MAG TPA: HDIG domain-containing protein [Pyrinomonadaceae bacterium]|nr:HDIG domain-containing protein [Pyrinomonadaceae bacterium]
MAKRIQDLKSPATRFSERITGDILRPFKALSENQRFWVGFASLCLATTLLINNPLWHVSSEPQYREGEIAREFVVSPADIYFTDTDETERLQKQARDQVKPIFRYESGKPEQAVQRFLSAWEALQRHGSESAANAKPTNSDIKNESHWVGAGGAEVGKTLASRSFTHNELDAVQSALREAAEGYIYDDSDQQYFQNQVSVFDRSHPNLQSTVAMPESSWTSLSAAREKFRTRLTAIRSLTQKEIDAFYTAGAILIEPSVSFDSAATETARAAATENIQPKPVVLRRGQKVIDAGDAVTPETLSKLAAISNYQSATRQFNRFLGLLFLITALYWVAWKFIQNRGPLHRFAGSAEKTFALFGFISVVQTVIMATLFRLADFTAAQNVKPPTNDPSIWAFAIPFATASLLMTLLADRPTALFTGLFVSIIAGFLAPRGLEFAVYAALASSIAVYGIGRYRSRQAVTIAGSLVGVGSALLAVAMIAYTQQPFILNTILMSIATGLAGGVVFTAAFTAVLLPVCESLFGILTDVKLLELSNADLPVLSQLAIRAPGTNQHSHAVGQLAENACRVVGGNALLARIGALYHDIGKTAAPEHFVENQVGIKNPHDRLKPSQSAKIIIAHVTYGQKLAREMGLPKRIIDFIPQHHGTRTLHYFLKKAQAAAQPGEDISENDFRYPGPKPQFKEAAIMMIADSCEAAARSLSEPTPENIRFIVTKIIDAILTDDQLDECDLTLRELTQIRESMIRSLIAIYHSRIDYPGYVPPPSGQFRITPEPESSAPASAEATPTIELAGVNRLKYQNPAEIPVSPGGEIEDEAINSDQTPKTSKKGSAS